MNLHLAEIAAAVAPGPHAVLLLDQAGWHMSDKLVIPTNITLVALPPKCPELNPSRECLGIHARQLAVEHDLSVLRRHRRSLLRGVEQTYKPALADHVDRPSGLGLSVMREILFVRVRNVIADVIFHYLGGQTVDGPAHGRDHHQNVGAANRRRFADRGGYVRLTLRI